MPLLGSDCRTPIPQGSARNRATDGLLILMMSATNARARIKRQGRRREYPVPGPALSGARILSGKCIRHGDAGNSAGAILRLKRARIFELTS